MGAVGFLYESVKDELKCAKLRVKFYTKMLMKIGAYVVMEDKDYNRLKTQNTKLSANEVAEKLIAVFGKGE